MKLRIWDRILSAVTGLLVAAAGVGIILHLTGLFSIGMLEGRLQAFGQNVLKIAGIVLGVVLILLGFHGLGMLFRRRRDKGFVIQRNELGDMSISMKALEAMAKRCVSIYPEMTINSTKIYRVRDGISVELKVTLASGVNIPLMVNALQKQIKQYITSCSGIDVQEVRVRVETDNSTKLLTAPEAVPAVEMPAAEPAIEAAAAGHISQHREEPKPAEEPVTAQEEQVVPETAAEEAEEAAALPENEPAAETAEEADEPEEAEEEFEPIEFDMEQTDANEEAQL